MPSTAADRSVRRRHALSAAAALAVVPAVAVALGGTAHAAPPTVETVTMPPYAVELAGAQSPCAFPITFTGAGTVRMTTYWDDADTPVRTTVHGSLDHTLFSEWATLSSPGPAPVTIDAATGQQVITGLQYRFSLPGHGPVMATAGRMVLGGDGTLLALTGLDRSDAEALCAALGPPGSLDR